jgi:polysaccharide chain length determinant protein (PEP-CTERM system associated)
MQESDITLASYFAIIKRRKWSLILPAGIVFLVALAVALLLPSVYKSTSTILIEEQEIPADFVMATVTTYAEQRLQALNQRIMSSTRLLGIIKRFDLYREMREKRTMDEVIAQMKADVHLDPISAEVIDKRTGRSKAVTIAFTLSYEGKERPETIQKVANVLISLFLEGNLQVRERQANETSQFLKDEMDKVKTRLTEMEGRISAFKEENIDRLPELLQVNLQSVQSTERDVAVLKEKLNSLMERAGYLDTQLAGIQPKLENGDPDLRRLKELKVSLDYLTSRYSDLYPDVKKTRAEIAELEKRIKTVAGAAGKGSDLPDNPAYITLDSQLSSARVQIVSIKAQVGELVKKGREYRKLIEAGPKVEETYRNLIIERDNTQAKYNDLMRKLMDARVSQGLEKEQKGERFTLIDPARLPEKPFKPNRLAIILIGLVLGVGAGVGMAALVEFGDDSVKSAADLTRATAFPVLISIPEIVTPRDRLRRRLKGLAWATVVILVAAGGVVAFDRMVMDLDVFWIKVARRLTM